MRKVNAVTFRATDPGPIVTEYLRYGGAVGVTGDGHTAYVPYAVEDALGRPTGRDVLLTLYRPPKCDGPSWAAAQIGRLASFGVKAVAWAESRR